MSRGKSDRVDNISVRGSSCHARIFGICDDQSMDRNSRKLEAFMAEHNNRADFRDMRLQLRSLGRVTIYNNGASINRTITLYKRKRWVRYIHQSTNATHKAALNIPNPPKCPKC